MARLVAAVALDRPTSEAALLMPGALTMPPARQPRPSPTMPRAMLSMSGRFQSASLMRCAVVTTPTVRSVAAVAAAMKAGISAGSKP